MRWSRISTTHKPQAQSRESRDRPARGAALTAKAHQHKGGKPDGYFDRVGAIQRRGRRRRAADGRVLREPQAGAGA